MKANLLKPHAIALALPALVLGCHGRPPISAAPDPSLESRAAEEAHAASPESQIGGATLWGTAFDKGGFSDFRVGLHAGHCYAFGFAGDAGVARMAMYLWSPEEKRLDSLHARAPEGAFKHCAKEDGMYRLQGKVTEGAGHFAVVTVEHPDAAAPAAPTPVDLAQMIEDQAVAAAPGATRVGDLLGGTSYTSDWFTPMEVGKCYWIIGAGESGKVKKLYLYLWDPKSKRITESRSDTNTAMVGHCPKEASGMFRFQAKLDSGHGEYKVGVYVK